MTSPRFGSFTLRTDCARCGQPVPVNAPAERVHCSYCQSDVPLPSAIWWQVLGTFDEEHHGLRAGRPVSKTIDIGGFTVHYEYARCALPEGAATMIDAPAWLRDLVHTVRAIYVTDASSVTSPAQVEGGVPNAVKPVLMGCPQCGSGLHITVESERTTTCKFCNADFYLPDDLWRRLHPVRVVERWYVRFEGKTRHDDVAAAERAAHQREQKAEHDRFEREKFTNEDVVERDVRVARARRSALLGVFGAYGTMLLSLVMFVFILTEGIGGEAGLPMCQAMIAGTIVASAVALFLASRVITLRAGPTNDAPMGLLWILFVTGLVAPVINHGIMALLAFNGAFQGKGRVADEQRLRHLTTSRWEQRPIALLFAGLTVWWPLAMWGLFELSGATMSGGRIHLH